MAHQDSSGISPYSYTPLTEPHSQIRLLKIPLDVGLFYGVASPKPLACTLAVFDIPIGSQSRARRLLRASQLPLFHALSYVWGDPTRSHEILIDGKRFPVTKNLYLALRSMQSGITGAMHVWADAICINQEDNPEKSAQIQLMREIYNTASEVRIWLGMVTPETARCLEFMFKLIGAYERVRGDPVEPSEDGGMQGAVPRVFASALTGFIRGGVRFGQGFVDFGDVWSAPVARDDKAKVIEVDGKLSLHQMTLQSSEGWSPSSKDLRGAEEMECDFIEVAKLIDEHLIQQLWFTRMWTVQEICCARDTAIQVGRTTMFWDDFVKVLNWLHFQKGAKLENIRKIIGLEIVRVGWNEGKRQLLKYLIRETTSREATDPRDKVYSLYGLMGDHMNDFLRPDCSLSVAEVYSRTTCHFITQSKSLDGLLGWQTSPSPGEEGVPGLPCWVPDYSLRQTYTPSPLVSVDGRESMYGASGYDQRAKYILGMKKIRSPLFGSTEDPSAAPIRMSVSMDRPVLRVKGIIIDKIVFVSPPLTTPPPLSPEGAANYGLTERNWLDELINSPPLQGQVAKEHLTLVFISHLANFYLARITQRNSQVSLGGGSIKPSPPAGFDSPEALQTHLAVLNNSDSLSYTYLQTLLSGRISTRERTTIEDLRQILVSPSVSSKLQSGKPQLEEELKFQEKVAEALTASLKYRRLAITEKGYMAAVAPGTRPGDVAAVVFGASVVCILRPEESLVIGIDELGNSGAKELGVESKREWEGVEQEEHTLVGEAYLHGYMDGEAIAMGMRGDLKESDFVLR